MPHPVVIGVNSPTSHSKQVDGDEGSVMRNEKYWSECRKTPVSSLFKPYNKCDKLEHFENLLALFILQPQHKSVVGHGGDGGAATACGGD